MQLLLLLLKEVGSATVQGRESDIHPISQKTPAPRYQPIDRKKRNGKIVEDHSRERAAYMDTWSGFEAAKTAPWQSRGLHHRGKFLVPSDE